jgi:lipopolysaccharide/colanic/teichoic acid biosynthesis glycosyltransferase
MSLGAGPSRNRGFEQSAAPYVVFLDDDCIASPDLIGRHHKTLASAVGPTVSLGPILPPPGRRFPVWTHWDADRWEREYRRLGSGDSQPEWGHLFSGNVGVRRADLLAVGGFDERLSRQEDIELGFRLDRYGCRFEFDPAAFVWHDSERPLESWLQLPAQSARFDVEFDRRVPDSGRLSGVHQRMTQSHWALRAARRTFRSPISRRFVINAAVAFARLLHALHMDRAALAAISLVWDLTYCEALRRETLSEHRAEHRSRTVGRRIRRTLDVLISASALTALAPLIVVIAALIRLTSPGPSLFKQRRVGLGREPFSLYKFRTMRVGGDDTALRELIARELRGVDTSTGGSCKLDADSRITPIGAFLRRTSLDELPQLINVLRGEMTMVGPRPCLDWEAEMFPSEFDARFTVPPGVTGLWQVSGRSTVGTLDMLRLDLEYVQSRSLLGDLAILARTVPAVLRGDGAR